VRAFEAYIAIDNWKRLLFLDVHASVA